VTLLLSHRAQAASEVLAEEDAEATETATGEDDRREDSNKSEPTALSLKETRAK
jgi:hypothetical protein